MYFSVVIPVFNQAETVERSVRSVLVQDPGVLLEVIVVDDGSADRSLEVAKGIGDPRVQVMTQHNSGPGGARNAGALVAKGEFLTFLDADDLALPDWLCAMQAAFAADVSTRAVLCGVLTRDHVSGRERTWLPTSPRRSDAFPQSPPFPGTFALRRQLFFELGGYEPELRIGENSELLFRLMSAYAARSWSIATVRRALVVHRNSLAPYPQGERRRTAEFMLRTHASALRRSPEVVRNYHAMIAADELQRGRRLSATRHYAKAFLTARSVKGLLRLVWVFVPKAVRVRVLRNRHATTR